MDRTRWIGMLVGVALLGTMGCFKSSTSQASSDSSSDSSSSCSPSDDKDPAYERDVSDYTARVVRSGEEPERMRDGITALAESHGVTNWEADEITFVGIGRGLADVRLGTSRLQTYVAALTGGRPDQMDWLRAGYAAARQ